LIIIDFFFFFLCFQKKISYFFYLVNFYISPSSCLVIKLIVIKGSWRSFQDSNFFQLWMNQLTKQLVDPEIKN
jgi:hypothetical protein